jgi:predicted 3-demethylubiquinone-9 3-methyltransferase (glyoxalase superfamily)
MFQLQMSSGDSGQVTRVIQAMMEMIKFDIAALQRAFDGH